METVEEAERVTDVEELSVMPVFNATDLEKLKLVEAFAPIQLPPIVTERFCRINLSKHSTSVDLVVLQLAS